MNPSNYPALTLSHGGVKMIIFAAVFWALAGVAITLRIWARALKAKPLAFNDYTLLVAGVFTSAQTGVSITSAVWAGSGHHLRDIAPQYRSRTFVVFAAGQPIWAAANTFVKLSMLHLYIVSFPSYRFRIICIATMVVSGLYFVTVLLETFLLCQPVQFNWDKTIPGKCSPHSRAAYVISGSMNLVIDVFIVVLPMPLLWKLRIPMSKKIGVMAMFSLGAVICIITLLRVIKIAKMDMADFTYASVDLSIFSILEPSLGILNASLPVLRPVGCAISKSAIVTWFKSCLGSFWVNRISGTSDSNGSTKATVPNTSTVDNVADPTDRLYQLDTLNLIGRENLERLVATNTNGNK